MLSSAYNWLQVDLITLFKLPEDPISCLTSARLDRETCPTELPWEKLCNTLTPVLSGAKGLFSVLFSPADADNTTPTNDKKSNCFLILK